MTEYIKNPLSGKLRGVTYEDGKIIDVHIRDTDDVVKVFVPLDNGVTVQEWIPVNDERKPKEGEDVLVAVFDGYDTYTDIDCLMRDGKWCFETENYKVTHWMEKPKPPKGE